MTQRKVAIVDDDDFEFLLKWLWQAQWNEDTKSFYAVSKENGKRIAMSRIIMKTPKGLDCDHINHDTLDNRKENLRNITHSENMMNARLCSTNKTGQRGVYITRGKYRARIMINQKYINLGLFDLLEDASNAYKNAFNEHFGHLDRKRGSFLYQEQP